MSNSEPSLKGRQNQHSFKCISTLIDHKSRVYEISWSPDGKTIASGSHDTTINLWDTKSNKLRNKLKWHQGPVFCVCWSPNGSMIASGSRDSTVRLWDASKGVRNSKMKWHNSRILCVAWSPDGRLIASGSDDNVVCLWDPYERELVNVLDGHGDDVLSVKWSPDGRYLASASKDNRIRIWDIQNNKLLNLLEGHSGPVRNIDWPQNSPVIASGSDDKTIRLWDPYSGRQLSVIEGHTKSVFSVCFSPHSHLIASKSDDGTVRLWQSDSGQLLAKLDEQSHFHPGGLRFHAESLLISTKGKSIYEIKVWSLLYKHFLDATALIDTEHYRNAKVVLLGDTGVGKSGLGLVLTGEKWKATESTHGRHVWTFESREISLPDGRIETREILLWDLAGQPGYRLIHQLHLQEITIALVVIDSRSETDPFAGVRHWNRALKQAQRLQGSSAGRLKKYLVIARTDRGGLSVSKERINTHLHEMQFDGYFETSAKEGWQITELSQAIREGIDWDNLPRVNSNNLFQTIKEFLIKEKSAGRLLTTAEDLYRLFAKTNSVSDSFGDFRAEFHTCIGRVESSGLIRRLSFGAYVLLQPELLDAYASAIANAAKTEPDGLGFLAEERALSCDFPISSDERISDQNQEKLLLISTIEELLKHEIALKETDDKGVDLVFPSQFTRERPDAPDVPGRAIVFNFEGPIANIYATLAVRLSRSSLFNKQEMWKNVATFKATVGGVCGIYLRELSEGEGELTLFFDADAIEQTRYQFEDYVAAHLKRRTAANSLSRFRIFICKTCNEPLTKTTIMRRRQRGYSFANCPVCDQKIELLDREERLKERMTATAATIAEMDRSADDQLGKDTVSLIMKGKKESNDYDVFICYNRANLNSVKDIAEQLKLNSIFPWLDEWEIRPGTDWQEALDKSIGNIRATAVFIGPDGIGPWQSLEQKAIIQQFVDRHLPVIPVILSGVKGKPNLPSFLKLLQLVDFRKSDPDPMEQLIWGITGERSSA